MENQLIESKYDENHSSQTCGICGYNEFKETTTVKEENAVTSTAKCLNCGEVNLMHRRST